MSLKLSMKKDWYYALLILGLGFEIAYFGNAVIHDDLNWWASDAPTYLEQAEYMMKGRLGEFYEINKFAMDHSTFPVGPYLYPLGYPAAMIPALKIWGHRFDMLKWYNLLFFFGFLVFLVFWMKERFPNWRIPALLLSATLCSHFFYQMFFDHLLSDLCFLFFAFLSIWVFQNRPSKYWTFVLGLIAFLAYQVRDFGIFLLLGFVLQLLFEQHARKQIIQICVPFVGLFLISKFFSFGSNEVHMKKLLEFNAQLVLDNFVYIVNTSANFFLDQKNGFGHREQHPYTLVIFILLAGFVLFGMIRNWKRDLHLSVFFLAQLAVILIWPNSVHQGARFFLPVYPLILIFIAKSFIEINSGWFRVVGFVVATVFLVSIFQESKGIAEEFGRMHWWQGNAEQSHEMYRTIAREVPENEVIISGSPRTIRFFTGRNGVMIPAKNEILESDFKYLLNINGVHASYSPQESDSLDFDLIEQGTVFRLYRIN